MQKVGSATVRDDPSGLWLSLIERFVRDEEVVDSNPARPTNALARISTEARHGDTHPT